MRILTSAAGVCFSGLAVWLLVRAIDVSSAASILANAELRVLALIGPILALQFLMRVVRWRILLPSRQDGAGVPVMRLSPVLLLGYLGNAVLPARLGELIRAYVVSRRESIPFPAAFGSVVVERVADTASVAIVAFFAAIAVGAPSWIAQASALIAVGGGAVLAGIATPHLGRVLLHAARWTRQGPVAFLRTATRYVAVAARVAEAAQRAARPRSILIAGMISTVAWGLDGMTFWLIGHALGIDLTPQGGLLIATWTVLGTALPSAPGYIGTFEIVAVAAALVVGIPAEPALALALVAHVATVIPVSVGGAIALSLLGGQLGSLARAARSAQQGVKPA